MRLILRRRGGRIPGEIPVTPFLARGDVLQHRVACALLVVSRVARCGDRLEAVRQAVLLLPLFYFTISVKEPTCTLVSPSFFLLRPQKLR